ncbi:Endoglucanase [Lunatimonas lonarensis]|uniref:Endoglucanase n=1 Tax=Lunatimonas lonarensis TaxID=1232681 RepID=R7ZM94_9BACT|nr:Endoglucanase [Lunatimonas lonarensis]
MFFYTGGLFAQQSSIHLLNQRLGRGVNIGNMFEAPEEGAWGNSFRDDYFSKIAGLGFDHVRIPIRWDTPSRTGQAAPYMINPTFLNRIQEVVDMALANGLMVIINMHHHDALFVSPVDEKEKFLAQWAQIAAHFESYPETLLFEVLNEPHAALTPRLWNVFFADALTVIRQTNPTRGVLMGTSEFGGVSGIAHLDPPKDSNIIVTVHFYSPFTFTHQGAEWVGEHTDEWLGTAWHDLVYEREALVQELESVADFSKRENIPIHMGEFGAYGKADMESRVRWTNFLSRYFDSVGYSWAYWEWSAGFGIYDPSTDTFKDRLVSALLHDPLDEPRNAYPSTLYLSNFATGSDGWNLINQQGAAGTLLTESNGLRVRITQGGNENWHSQLSRHGFDLKQGKLYRVSFTAQAQAPTTLTHYMGESLSPYRAYSGYQGFQVSETEREFAYIFKMLSADDVNARMVLDLGQKETSLWFKSMKLEQLDFLVSSIPLEPVEKIYAYPNPVEGKLYLEGVLRGTSGKLITPNGQLLVELDLDPQMPTINMAGYPAGLYFLQLTTATSSQILRIIKK